jgi:hypothetical protein
VKLKKTLLNVSWFASPVTYAVVYTAFNMRHRRRKNEIQLAYDAAAKRIVAAIEDIHVDFTEVSTMLDEESAFLKTIDPNYK